MPVLKHRFIFPKNSKGIFRGLPAKLIANFEKKKTVCQAVQFFQTRFPTNFYFVMFHTIIIYVEFYHEIL